MNRFRIFALSLLAGLLCASAQANQPKPPRLVVGIVVENLSGDYLRQCRQRLSPDGFRKVFEQGASTFHLSVPYAYAGFAPDYASIMTGATPSIHKIISNECANKADAVAVPTLMEALKTATQGQAKTIVIKQDAWLSAKNALTNDPTLLLVRLSADMFPERGRREAELYKQLDIQLADFLKALSAKYAPEEYLLFVVGTQTDSVTPDANKFSPSRAQSLLNMFLTAKYGQVQWVRRFEGRQVYLNREAIEERGYRVEGIAAAVADFLSQLDGVQTAYTAQQLENACGDDLFQRMQRGYVRGVSGDVVLALTPAWVLTDEQGKIVDCAGKLSGEVPFALYGNGIKPQEIRSEATILDIAPTVCRRLQIGTPSGSVGKLILN